MVTDGNPTYPITDGLEVPPKPPRSCTDPSTSHSTECGPATKGGITVFPHLPETPTAWPTSFNPNAIPTVLPCGGSSRGIGREPGPRSRLRNPALEARRRYVLSPS